MADLPDWPYWKVISITGQSGAGTDYAVELEIGDSAGGDFHLEGHCTNFPQDITVTDDDGITLLDYSIKDITADPIIMSVKVADDLGSNQTIRIYYGKSGETTNSDGSATFIGFFDGDSTGWTEVDGTGSSIVFQNDRLEFATLARNENTYVYQQIAGIDELEVTFKTQVTGLSGVLAFTYFGLGDGIGTVRSLSNAIMVMRDSTQAYTRKTVSSAGSNGELIISNEANVLYYKGTVLGDVFTVKVYSDEAMTTQVGVTSDISVADLTISNLTYLYIISSFNSGHVDWATGYLDNCVIRRRISTEPTFSSAGAEQTPTPPTVKPMWYYDMLKRRNR